MFGHALAMVVSVVAQARAKMSMETLSVTSCLKSDSSWLRHIARNCTNGFRSPKEGIVISYLIPLSSKLKESWPD